MNSGRNLVIGVDPLCLNACFVGDMFEHLWTLVFIADLSHEEADLVERVRYLVAQLVDEERLARLARSDNERELIEECVLTIKFPIELHNAHAFLVLSKILQLFINGLL